MPAAATRLPPALSPCRFCCLQLRLSLPVTLLVTSLLGQRGVKEDFPLNPIESEICLPWITQPYCTVLTIVRLRGPYSCSQYSALCTALLRLTAVNNNAGVCQTAPPAPAHAPLPLLING